MEHDGTFASHKQVAYLHLLKTKAGVANCDGNCAFEVEEWSKRANASVKKTKYCVYHTQLRAFKNVDGIAIMTSKDLSEDQISNLIERYEEKIRLQEIRESEGPDLDAAFDQAEQNAKIRGELGPGADG